ncbi:MAG: amino acid permease [Halobacteriales archaeon]|nr:amino acid permease [Halobacteriales archaeon]
MSDDELAKDLGLLSALTIGIGTMIGAGIFVLPGLAAEEAGPAVALSFVLGGAIAMLTALSASELGTAMPKAGGAYYYINRALGPLFGSVAGMGNWLGLSFASAFYVVGFGSYLAVFVTLPSIDLVVFTLSANQIGGIAAGALFVGINYFGAKETGGAQNVIVVTLVLILTLFAFIGFLNADFSTLRPFAPEATGGYPAVLPAAGLIFVSFLGFVQITTVAEELKNPGRNLPIAVIGSVGIVTVMYAVLMVVLMGVVSWERIAEFGETAVVDVAGIAFVGTFGESILFGLLPTATVGIALLTFAGLLATASSANASILASSRINFAMGRDKIVPDALNEIHPRFATPYRSILVTGVITLLFVVGGTVEILAQAASVLHLVVYGLLNVALIVFRQADPEDYDPEFRVPLYPIVPILGAVLSFALIYFMNPTDWLLSGVLIVGTVVWYFAYARRQTEEEGVLARYVREEADELPGAAVSATDAVSPEEYRVMVPVSNPRTERDLVEIGSTLAKANDGKVVAVHVVTVPDQTSLRVAAESEAFSGDEALIEDARKHAEEAGVPVETHTVFSHRGLEEVFDAAREYRANLVVMGRGEEGRLSAGHVGSAVDELAHDLPCDFLVFDDRDRDTSRVLFPTAGGPHSELGAEVARALRDIAGSEIRLLHVAEDEEEGHEFLDEWAAEHGLEDAELVVVSGDVEEAIEAEAEDASLLLIGAVGGGLVSRLVRGSLVYDVLEEVDTSVLIAERARDRSLLERIFGG